MDEKKELSALEKRYQRLRWAQWILFALSIITATCPGAAVAIKVGLRYKSAENGWSLAGFCIVVLGIAIAFMIRGLFRKFSDKISWVLGATVASWVLVLLLWSLQAIIEDALLISWALGIGCSVALIISSISDLCKVQADGIEEEYKRRQNNRRE